ncbi:ATP-grasp domain-containing protein [Candidatus Nitrosocosmicus franklandus]|uniref:Carbamoyl phosphate synthase-like protein n=1 Tax=Candidatus Nitrosocosmicus franklandianus TaxID=1798806 RepID=A0A484I6E6_9ARCH|nr:ATP-grasp domain-containing protein [Candidatus Nitrosocosmicus franklandus]VFJ12347.1 Carbamoyl phosphate synthase-like protein [Candidatus Nitrosocosmicus franklandus]
MDTIIKNGCRLHREISTVLIPGASAPAGINTIKSLRLSGFKGKILSTDSNSLSAGFYLSDFYEVIPEAEADNYLEVLLNIIDKYSIQVLMPSSGYDIFPFSEHKSKLKKHGVFPVVSDRKILEICRDKISTFNNLKTEFRLPFTTLNPEEVSVYPVIAKPRYGKGSRDIVQVNDEQDLRYVSSKFSDMIYQEYLPGDEYTIDVMSDLEGNPIVSVPRIRVQTKSGISTKGKIVLDKYLIEESMKIVRKLRIIGPSCIQMKKDKLGEFKLVEINPRLGGGTIFATLAGANFPKMIIDLIEGKTIVQPKISEITVLRYFEEIVLDERNKINYIGKDLLTSNACHV